MTDDDKTFMARAIALSEIAGLVESTGGVFGAVIVQDGKIVAEGQNRVVQHNDPTWHGEMEAIRTACRTTGSFKLREATLYSSAEPCPMCLAAAYWAGIRHIYYASTNADALEYGDFDDSMIYGEVRKPNAERMIPCQQMMREEAVLVWRKYRNKADRVPY